MRISKKQPILEKLGIDHPIFLSPMAGVGTPKLAAAVSDAGGLGALGLGASTVAQARQMILETKALTDRPFVANFFCHQSAPSDTAKNQAWLDRLAPVFEKFGASPPQDLNCIYGSFLDNDALLALVLETDVKVVSFHFGLPHRHQLTALRQANIITMASVTNYSEAKLAYEAGIDILIAQGIQAGGHRGIFCQTHDTAMMTDDLVRLIKEHFDVPVVAAGGLMTGQEIKTVLKMGADAAQLGTAFVLCPESSASDAYRQALLAKPTTEITACISGRQARGISNAWHRLGYDLDIPAYPYTYDAAKALHALASSQGCQDYGAFWAGTGVGRIRQLPASLLMQTLIAEMLAT